MEIRTIRFDSDPVGAAPCGWTSTCTGASEPRWTVEQEGTAPSKLKIVRQSGQGKFPLLLQDDVVVRDGFVEARFKSIEGSQDRAAGLVWRVSDANNYYVARANALEDNVVLYM
jgi:hypothetical protein